VCCGSRSSVTNFTCDPCVVSCYRNPTFEIRIEREREDLKFFGALAAPVELLSCVWGAMFRIAAQFNTCGGDALSCCHSW
jgi:hypothetical protein